MSTAKRGQAAGTRPRADASPARQDSPRPPSRRREQKPFPFSEGRPALASRHAGPCARKMSASSIAGRDMRAASGGRRGGLEGFDEMIELAHHLTQRIGRNPRVERRRVEFGMTKQNLNHTNIDILLQQMRGKAVPQRMRAYALVDLGQLRR